MSALTEVRDVARRCGTQWTEFNGGKHVRIHGLVDVEYHPLSKRQTAYVYGMTTGIHGVSPDLAVSMATHPFLIPESSIKHSKRRSDYRTAKLKLLERDPHCFWCRTELQTDSATVDHYIPLSRGGPNRKSNYILACRPCNLERGDTMPIGTNQPESYNREDNDECLLDNLEKVQTVEGKKRVLSQHYAIQLSSARQAERERIKEKIRSRQDELRAQAQDLRDEARSIDAQVSVYSDLLRSGIVDA